VDTALAVTRHEGLQTRMKAKTARKRLKDLGSNEKAEVAQRFFKTGPGEYGEGDVFLGVRVPELRRLAKEFLDLGPGEVRDLLRSHIHEDRALALLILVRNYRRGDPKEQERIYQFYMDHLRFINNWDLVDVSAEHVVGAFLKGKCKRPLYRLARSKNLWERRVSVLATFHYIKGSEFSETLKIAEMLLSDKEDLIHKAVGWMLREVGKRDPAAEEKFLEKHSKKMPRTMLRYAIERFPEPKRQRYLKGRV
jgi:3-methyladenine DNA glycosylase AlkD